MFANGVTMTGVTAPTAVTLAAGHLPRALLAQQLGLFSPALNDLGAFNPYLSGGLGNSSLGALGALPFLGGGFGGGGGGGGSSLSAGVVPYTPTPEIASSTSSTLAQGQAIVNVNLNDMGLDPGSITVSPGATVRWNNYSRHSAVIASEAGSFDSGPLDSGRTYSRTFNRPGVYPYQATVSSAYPENLSGTIVVE
jgi:plastocyanin